MWLDLLKALSRYSASSWNCVPSWFMDCWSRSAISLGSFRGRTVCRFLTVDGSAIVSDKTSISSSSSSS